MLFWRVHPLVFPRPKQCKTPRKYSSFTTQFGSTHSYVNLCDDPLILKKMCFFGVFEGVVIAAIAAHTKASQPPKHPQTARKTVPRNGSWNFGLRVARGSCGAKAPCRRAPLWSDPVGACNCAPSPRAFGSSPPREDTMGEERRREEMETGRGTCDNEWSTQRAQ